MLTWNRATIAKGKDSSNPFTPNVLLMLFRPFKKASHKTELDTSNGVSSVLENHHKKLTLSTFSEIPFVV